jgi:predicted RNase H-like HicB family nuclease
MAVRTNTWKSPAVSASSTSRNGHNFRASKRRAPSKNSGKHSAAGRREEVTYVVLYEKGRHNFSAYVPDLPGCVATGKTLKAVEKSMREAIAFHIESLREHGEPVPEPTIVGAEMVLAG